MKSEFVISLIAMTSMLMGALLFLYAWRSRRSADEVALLLVDRGPAGRHPGDEDPAAVSRESQERTKRVTQVLFHVREELYGRQLLHLWGLVFLVVCMLWILGRGFSLVGLLMGTVLICSVALLIQGALKRRVSTAVIKEIDFYLPIVMERLVMAVEAGLDVLPAMKCIVDLARINVDGEVLESARHLDPVTRLLWVVVSLVGAGLSFDDALREVASVVQSPAFKHALVHLAVAHREGGELIMPLRELSDATQLYFQESIEEEIAKMPVRATMPLLCTFAGLIIFFVTAPLMQVLGLMSAAMPK